MTLGAQLHLGHPGREVAAEYFMPARGSACLGAKPEIGGLWTSSWAGEHGSGWVQWMLDNEWGISREDARHEHCWLLTPTPDVRVFTIDSYADLERLVDEHGQPGVVGGEVPDWESIAASYDAVRLTDAGQWATRLTHPLCLYGWDCESTLWLRWAFAAIEFVGEQRFVAGNPWWEEAEHAAG